MADNTYRGFVERVSPRVLLGPFGRRLGGIIAFFFDQLAEGITEAAHAPLIADPTGVGPAQDALGPAGHELSLPRYPDETPEQYEGRLERAWVDYPYAGDEDPIIAQLATAGFPGAKVYNPSDWPAKEPIGYWSQFWVFFPVGTHTVTSAGPLIGSFTVGDGTIVGPVGITPTELHTMREIIAKWKPGHWICRGIVFEVSGWTVGDGSIVGTPNLFVGGDHVDVGA